MEATSSIQEEIFFLEGIINSTIDEQKETFFKYQSILLLPLHFQRSKRIISGKL
jgi:hypothetical protein